jgi:hypothetical protein
LNVNINEKQLTYQEGVLSLNGTQITWIENQGKAIEDFSIESNIVFIASSEFPNEI